MESVRSQLREGATRNNSVLADSRLAMEIHTQLGCGIWQA
jgi:hypothetical protein